MSFVHQLLTEQLDIWTAADAESKSGRGRGSGNSTKVYGVQKLRALILELAVRGKLLQQEPNDEPASELADRTHYYQKLGFGIVGREYIPHEDENGVQIPHVSARDEDGNQLTEYVMRYPAPNLYQVPPFDDSDTKKLPKLPEERLDRDLPPLPEEFDEKELTLDAAQELWANERSEGGA